MDPHDRPDGIGNKQHTYLKLQVAGTWNGEKKANVSCLSKLISRVHMILYLSWPRSLRNLPTRGWEEQRPSASLLSALRSSGCSITVSNAIGLGKNLAVGKALQTASKKRPFSSQSEKQDSQIATRIKGPVVGQNHPTYLHDERFSVCDSLSFPRTKNLVDLQFPFRCR